MANSFNIRNCGEFKLVIHFNKIKVYQTLWGNISLSLSMSFFAFKVFLFFLLTLQSFPSTLCICKKFCSHASGSHVLDAYNMNTYNKKLVKIFWTSYRNGPIITSKNLIEKYKSNKMIMKYKFEYNIMKYMKAFLL